MLTKKQMAAAVVATLKNKLVADFADPIVKKYVDKYTRKELTDLYEKARAASVVHQ